VFHSTAVNVLVSEATYINVSENSCEMGLLVIYIQQVSQVGSATENKVWYGSLFNNFILSNRKIEVSNLP
jgi:hypothetical protein